jgi:nitronate monooxygenase
MPLPKILQDNLAIPVIGSPLFLVSGPELVIAQCKAGIVGSFPALNARPQHVLEEWLIRIKEELAQAKAENPIYQLRHMQLIKFVMRLMID